MEQYERLKNLFLLAGEAEWIFDKWMNDKNLWLNNQTPMEWVKNGYVGELVMFAAQEFIGDSQVDYCE